VAGGAEHEGLASSLGHDPGPFGLVWLPGLVEVCELADLVNLHLVRISADLAPSSAEPIDQLLAGCGGRDWRAVVEGRVLLPYERDTTERCDQWFASLAALNSGLQALAWPGSDR